MASSLTLKEMSIRAQATAFRYVICHSQGMALVYIICTKVFDPTGTLLGKFFLNTTSSNMVFAGKGRLVIMAETAIYLAEIEAGGFDVAFP